LALIVVDLDAWQRADIAAHGVDGAREDPGVASADRARLAGLEGDDGIA
jgi:hypothetical protein